jgi:ABC-type sugar transport system permease subunit
VWTFLFAFLSVLFAFAFGLFFALIFDHPKLPGKKVIRSLLIIPYALPAFISVNIWRSMFSRHFGIISQGLESLFGSSPLWLADPTWARVGIIIVQVWLGFPYMMLICTGALQSLPTDVYEAAKIDGASPLRQFWNITLPLLLVAVGPLLIASFAFNFNNFTVIDIYAEGGPPIAGAATPAGHTDILITYVFRLAFASGRGADFGYASAITIVIFLILTVITALQFRYTRVWEEVSENV